MSVIDDAKFLYNDITSRMRQRVRDYGDTLDAGSTPSRMLKNLIEAEVGLDGELNSDAENERLRDKAMEPFMSPSLKPMPEFDSDKSTFINPVRQLLKAWMKSGKIKKVDEVTTALAEAEASKKTGAFSTLYDKKIKHEVDDSKFEFKKKPWDMRPNEYYPADEIVEHSVLKNLFPNDWAELQFKLDPKAHSAYYRPSDKSISLPARAFQQKDPLDSLSGDAIHEFTHFVKDAENDPSLYPTEVLHNYHKSTRGGNYYPNKEKLLNSMEYQDAYQRFKNGEISWTQVTEIPVFQKYLRSIGDTPQGHYWRAAEEWEARVADSRRKLTKKQRTETAFPTPFSADELITRERPIKQMNKVLTDREKLIGELYGTKWIDWIK